MLEVTFGTAQTDRSGVRIKMKTQKCQNQPATANPNAALSPKLPQKVSFLKHNEAIRHEAWQDGNNKQNEVADPAVILQNQREGDGSAGPEKKRGNMELVEKKCDQSREALSRALCCRSRSLIACMWKSCSRPFSHARTHTHIHVRAHARSSCDSFLPSWLLSFISPVAVNVSYAIGGRGFAQMDPLPYERCNPTDDKVRPRLHMTLGCANWKEKKFKRKD